MKRNQEKAIAALLTSDTQAEAAKKCGLSVRTLRLYLDDPEFFTEYQQRRQQLVTDATKKLQNYIQSAVDTLFEIKNDPETPPGIRASAARALLEYGMKYTDMTDLAERITALEKETEVEQ